MRQPWVPDLGVKASGGIRTWRISGRWSRPAPTRIGASASVKIVEAIRRHDSIGIFMPAQHPATKQRTLRRTAPSCSTFCSKCPQITAETLDLDKHARKPRRDRQGRHALRSVRDPALQRTRRAACTIRYSIGHRDEVVRISVIPLGRRHHRRRGRARAAGSGRRRPQDPRYLNALDAVRSELAVPMIGPQQAGGCDRRCSRRARTRTRNRTARCCD